MAGVTKQKKATARPKRGEAKGVKNEIPLPEKELRKLLRKMQLLRTFEEATRAKYLEGKVYGFCHLYLGQEATAVGSISVLRPDDYLISSYRDHGHCLAVGTEPDRIMAELFGRETGVSKGRGGSMHLFDAKRNFLGGDAIVGGQIPLAVGVSVALKQLGKGQVILCFFGDGALNEGAFHESLNLASLWKLPIIFICENNAYGMGTSIERASAVTQATKRAEAYDMATDRVDGMDVLAVRTATEKALRRAREENLPTFLEMICYRFVGHSMMDPAKYRDRDEIQEWVRRDPIEQLKTRMTGWGLLTKADWEAVVKDVEREVAEAVAFAETSPEPQLATLEDWVYSDSGKGV